MVSSEFFVSLERNGVDVSAGLNRFMGNQELYLRFLCRLPETLHPADWRRLLREGDGEAFYAAIHDLKGTTGNLSVCPLYSLCCHLLEEYRAYGLTHTAQMEMLLDKLDAASLPLIQLIQEFQGGSSCATHCL